MKKKTEAQKAVAAAQRGYEASRQSTDARAGGFYDLLQNAQRARLQEITTTRINTRLTDLPESRQKIWGVPISA